MGQNRDWKTGSSSLVLVVEDNESDQLLARRGLGKLEIPCRMELACDGQEALDYLLDPVKELPNLILLDLKMPRVNGKEVLARVRSTERTRRCPVVIFTSSSEFSDIMGCFEGGANSYVRKAVELDEYMEKLTKLAEYWLRINEAC
jgi:CheY-like chemotaxis protein